MLSRAPAPAAATSPSSGLPDHAVAANPQELIGLREYGYDYVIDATGVPAAAQAGFDALDRGRTLLIFGVAHEDEKLARADRA